MPDKLYAHRANPRHFLLVRREKRFPYATHDRLQWRVVALGVEPVSESDKLTLKRQGFCEYKVDEAY